MNNTTTKSKGHNKDNRVSLRVTEIHWNPLPAASPSVLQRQNDQQETKPIIIEANIPTNPQSEFDDFVPHPEADRKAKSEWNPEEQALLNWFFINYENLKAQAETIQYTIDIAGLHLVLARGPIVCGSGQAVNDLRLLKHDPVRFHDLLKQRHLRELGQWK